jgi:hypothetical protein
MPVKRYVNTPSFEGVAAGQTARLRLPPIGNIHGVNITYASVTLAQMLAIRVKLNNRVIFTGTGTQLDALNQNRGLTAAGGILAFYFDRYNLMSRDMEVLTAIRAGNPDPTTGISINEILIEIDVDAAATGVTLSAQYQFSNFQYIAGQDGKPSIGYYKHTHNFTNAPSGAATVTINDLPKQGASYQLMNSISLNSSAITALRLIVNNETLVEGTLAQLQRLNVDGVRVTVSNWVHIDFTGWGYGSELLELFGAGLVDLRLEVTVSGATTIYGWVEYIGLHSA